MTKMRSLNTSQEPGFSLGLKLEMTGEDVPFSKSGEPSSLGSAVTPFLTPLRAPYTS